MSRESTPSTVNRLRGQRYWTRTSCQRVYRLPIFCQIHVGRGVWLRAMCDTKRRPRRHSYTQHLHILDAIGSGSVGSPSSDAFHVSIDRYLRYNLLTTVRDNLFTGLGRLERM